MNIRPAHRVRRFFEEERGSLWAPPSMDTGSAVQTNDSTPTSAPGTAITANATAHTKGTTPTTLIASTNFDTYMVELRIFATATSATNTASLMDIMIGAAAAETVIIPNLIAGHADQMAPSGSAWSGGRRYRFPLYIPAGSRISARMQSAVSSKVGRVTIRLYGQAADPVGPWTGERVTDYGTNLATSQGVTVALGLSSTEGTWTQIVAAATNPIRYLAIGLGSAGASTNPAVSLILADAGVGAATESAILQDSGHVSLGSDGGGMYESMGGYCEVPAGERLVARASKGVATAQNVDIILYGVD